MPARPPFTRERIRKIAEALPCAPRVLTELQGVLAHASAGIPEITLLLRRDPALTARVIRIANGVVYGRGEPVGSLEEALARVGSSEVYRLTSVAAMLQLAETPLRFYPITARALRENSLLCALVMEELAGEARQDVRLAYTAGLLRSVGVVVLDLAAQRDLRDLRPPAMGPDGLLTWERALFGLTSGEAAATVLKAWHFHADVFVAVRDQYLDGLAVDPLPLAKLLHVAVGAVETAGHGLPGAAIYLERHGAQAREDLRLSEENVADAIRRAQAKFESMKDLLG